MADLNVKMGVSGVSQFIQGMQQAGASVKTIDAALKQNEKQLKATGDAATYMQQKEQLLQGKLTEQKRIIKETEAALKTLDANGTSKVSKSYQDMQRRLLEAQTAMMDTQEQINNLGTASVEASAETDKLANSLGGLNRKVSLEQVTSAIKSITGSLEAAAGKAVQLGQTIWDNVMSSAQWADDTATMALMYGIDLDTFQRMQKLVTNGMDTSVDAILKAQSKLKNNAGTGSDSFMETLRELNLLQANASKYGQLEILPEDSVDLFWEAGRAIMNLTDEYKQEAYAQDLFGRSWKELIPLFDKYASREDYEKALNDVNVNTEEEVNALAELNDKVGELKGNFETLSNSIWANMAPAMTAAADSLNGLLTSVLEYLETPEGKQALDDMSKAVEGLFSDLSSIDPEQVVAGFSEVFTSIVGGLQWLSENSGTVIGALEAVVYGWGALQLFGGALEIYKLIQGILGLGGAAGAAAEAGAAAGASWGGAFANAVLAAAPWLAGLITLLKPADSANNEWDTLYNEQTGKMTAAGWSEFYNHPENWQDTIDSVGEMFGDLGRILSNPDAINAMATFRMYGDEERLIREMEALGYVRRIIEELPPALPAGSSAVDDDRTVIPMSFYKKWGAHLDAEEGAEEIEEQVGTVEIPVTLVVHDIDTNGIDVDLDSLIDADGNHANGLWSVPFDGYRAVLHKGERVVPAREVAAGRSYSSNLYVESMYMNNGQDAEGLAAAMAAAQRRTSSGYGS